LLIVEKRKDSANMKTNLDRQYRHSRINLAATGQNILRLRSERSLSVKDIQLELGLETPQAVYRWQRGETLPTVDNLYILSRVMGIYMDDVIVPYNE
jgi:hypothetical protein